MTLLNGTGQPGGKDRPLTVAELRERPTISVEEYGDTMDITRGGAYAAVRRGEVQVIRIGRRLLVPTVPLLRQLGVEDRP